MNSGIEVLTTILKKSYKHWSFYIIPVIMILTHSIQSFVGKSMSLFVIITLGLLIAEILYFTIFTNYFFNNGTFDNPDASFSKILKIIIIQSIKVLTIMFILTILTFILVPESQNAYTTNIFAKAVLNIVCGLTLLIANMGFTVAFINLNTKKSFSLSFSLVKTKFMLYNLLVLLVIIILSMLGMGSSPQKMNISELEKIVNLVLSMIVFMFIPFSIIFLTKLAIVKNYFSEKE